MNTIEWTDDLCVGVKKIDEQHARLTETINKLYYAYMNGDEKQVLSQIIDDINDYAKTHFATEEQFMEMYADEYAEYERHKELHKEFFSKAIDFLFKFIDGDSDITPELLDYLTDWWINHIKGIDAGLGAFLSEKGVC